MKRYCGTHHNDADAENGTCLSDPAMKVGTASSHESDLAEKKKRPRCEHCAM
jgi:hypothetical protein